MATGGATWKDKPIPQWNEDDAKQVLTDSPWAKTVTPTLNQQSKNNSPPRGLGRGGGIGIGGIGIGLPGGMGRRGGMGYPGGGYPGGGYPGGGNDTGTANTQPPTLTIRWESALPVREAELKTRDNSAPTVDEKYYAIAVYGVPDRMLRGDDKTIADQLKNKAAIKRDGKKDLKPSSVEVLRREDGPLIVYLFPRSKEITRADKRVELDAKIFRLDFAQSFYVDDMMFQGKLEM